MTEVADLTFLCKFELVLEDWPVTGRIVHILCENINLPDRLSSNPLLQSTIYETSESRKYTVNRHDSARE